MLHFKTLHRQQPISKPVASRTIWLPLLGVTGLAALAAAVLPKADTTRAAHERAGPVAQALDGEGKIAAGSAEWIDLWGVHAPTVGAADDASSSLASLTLTLGQNLQCTVMDQDGHGRIVGRCDLPDGRALTALMIDGDTAGTLGQ